MVGYEGSDETCLRREVWRGPYDMSVRRNERTDEHNA